MIIPTLPVIKSTPDNPTTYVAQSRNVRSFAKNWSELQKLLPKEGIDSGFGYSVSLSNNTTIIGAPYDDTFGTWSGAAYLFTYNGINWTQQTKLLDPDEASYDHFGCSVSLDEGTALIGATDNRTTAVAYVFVRSGSTWSLQQKLSIANFTEDYWESVHVSLAKDTALIGVAGNCEHGCNAGSAFIFTRTGTTWTQQQVLVSSDITAYDNFGCSVVISGDTALIGAEGDDDSGPVSGSVYVFTYSGTIWGQHQKLLASDGAAQDMFGYSVALDGSTALIGSPNDADLGNYSGSVYVFIRSDETWIEQQKLLSLDGEQNDCFGSSVTLQGNTALVGAPYENQSGMDAGAAYAFIRSGTTWSQRQKLLASDGTEMDFFGCAVVLETDTVLIGALNDNPGSVYVFGRDNQPPEPPIITGSSKGKVGVKMEYNFTATDPEGDEIYFFIDWGDSINTSWIGPYSSGEIITEFHHWSKKGDYTIKVKAKDTYGKESDWGTLSVTMPLSYEPPQFNFIAWFFERFPHAFPILRHLLGY